MQFVRDRSDMVLRFFIGLENHRERFALLKDFLARTGIHRVLLFSAGFAEGSSFRPLSYYREHAAMLAPYMEQLRQMGVETGINILFTVGHCFYPQEPTDSDLSFRRAVTVDGEPSRGCACLIDEKLLAYIREEYR
ncbi:MAG: hypothetical protein MJ078_07150, partial [Clostridia bacterium]|nr:hypothetical protein [Clostridia bacterium]